MAATQTYVIYEDQSEIIVREKLPDDEMEQAIQSISRALLSKEGESLSDLLYDKKRIWLFEEATHAEPYRTAIVEREHELFEKALSDIVSEETKKEHIKFILLGCGLGKLEIESFVLPYAKKGCYPPATIYPSDKNIEVLIEAEKCIAERIAGFKDTIHFDKHDRKQIDLSDRGNLKSRIKHTPNSSNVIVLAGRTFGNFDDENYLLNEIYNALSEDDVFVFTVGLVQEYEEMKKPYVTKEAMRWLSEPFVEIGSKMVNISLDYDQKKMRFEWKVSFLHPTWGKRFLVEDKSLIISNRYTPLAVTKMLDRNGFSYKEKVCSDISAEIYVCRKSPPKRLKGKIFSRTGIATMATAGAAVLAAIGYAHSEELVSIYNEKAVSTARIASRSSQQLGEYLFKEKRGADEVRNICKNPFFDRRIASRMEKDYMLEQFASCIASTKNPDDAVLKPVYEDIFRKIKESEFLINKVRRDIATKKAFIALYNSGIIRGVDSFLEKSGFSKGEKANTRLIFNHLLEKSQTAEIPASLEAITGSDRVRYLENLSMIAMDYGDLATSKERLVAAKEAADKIDAASEVKARILANLIEIDALQRNNTSLAQYQKDLHTLLDKLNPEDAGWAHYHIGESLWRVRQPEKAIEEYERALGKKGSKTLEGWTRHKICEAYYDLGDYEKAKKECERALGIFRSNETEKDNSGQLWSRFTLAKVYAGSGNVDAKEMFESLSKEFTDINGFICSNNNLARIALLAGDTKSARKHLEISSRSLDDPKKSTPSGKYEYFLSKLMQGYINLHEKNNERAREFFRSGLEIIETLEKESKITYLLEKASCLKHLDKNAYDKIAKEVEKSTLKGIKDELLLNF